MFLFVLTGVRTSVCLWGVIFDPPPAYSEYELFSQTEHSHVVTKNGVYIVMGV